MAIADAGTAKRTYRWDEVDQMLASGDVRGKLSKDDLPTPALIVDLDAFESNIRKMTTYVAGKGLALRPHAKTHKCPEIAKRLIAAGAVGACAAKLSEAIALADEGVTGLLVTTAVIGRQKIERAMALAARQPETIFCVDNASNAQDLNDAAAVAGLRLNVAIDLFVGRRTGVAPGAAAIAVAEAVDKLPHLRLAGLQAYAGQASHTVGFAERRQTSIEVMTPAADTRRELEKKGIACPLLTGGSTGTYNIDSSIDGINELQPGSFIFMDLDYNRIGGESGSEVYNDFQNSLFVRATVVSRPSKDLAIVDAGLKAFSTDKPIVPRWRDGDDLPYTFAGDEHGRLHLSTREAQVGERYEFIVPHCDPSVNLYDRMYAVRGDQVEAVWRIAGRGKSQ